jgi:hypothetical protein
MPPPRMRGVCPDTLDAVSGALKHAVSAPCLIALALVLGSGLGAAPSPSVSGTRLAGVRLGPHAVGFAVRSTVDPTRHVNAVDAGVRITLATWYPATRYASMAPAMTALAYHLLPLGTADDADRRRYEEDEITALCSWRHVGIVELTREQASQSLHTAGIARRDAPAHEGTWPVVLLMGGPFYLASTAEMLASHGFVVIAPFRTDDQQNDVNAQAFPWYLENAVRDAEWAVHVVLSSRRIAPPRLFAMGHGGGGMQALLFTMRNRNVSALVDIDAANFSSRSRARDLAFYSPRLLRVPYLHILREETRRDQDQYDDFTAMAFGRRVEVVLQDEAVRHHDLSDIGRAVAQPMRIRGDAQSSVEREYADVQDTIVRFLQAPADAAGQTAAETWLTSHDGASRHAVKVYAAIEPAPVVQQVIATLDASTPALLRAAHDRDPNAAVFDATNLARIIERAMVGPGPRTAIAIADVSREIHPDDPVFLALKSEASQAAGDPAAALSAARACAATPAGDDWHVKATVTRCQDEVKRLVKD